MLHREQIIHWCGEAGQDIAATQAVANAKDAPFKVIRGVDGDSAFLWVDHPHQLHTISEVEKHLAEQPSRPLPRRQEVNGKVRCTMEWPVKS